MSSTPGRRAAVVVVSFVFLFFSFPLPTGQTGYLPLAAAAAAAEVGFTPSFLSAPVLGAQRCPTVWRVISGIRGCGSGLRRGLVALFYALSSRLLQP